MSIHLYMDLAPCLSTSVLECGASAVWSRLFLRVDLLNGSAYMYLGFFWQRLSRTKLHTLIFERANGKMLTNGASIRLATKSYYTHFIACTGCLLACDAASMQHFLDSLRVSSPISSMKVSGFLGFWSLCKKGRGDDIFAVIFHFSSACFMKGASHSTRSGLKS